MAKRLRCVEQTKSSRILLDGSDYVSRGIEKTQKTSIEEACVELVSRHLSSLY